MAHTFRSHHYRPDRLDAKQHASRRKAARRLDPLDGEDEVPGSDEVQS